MFKESPDIPSGFNQPTALPKTAEEAQSWQQVNRAWWESHPMRYDWEAELGLKEFSREFYEEIDRRFFSEADKFLPRNKLPFDRLIPFDKLPRWDVLEIGVGNGSHAGLLARHAKSFTGIDLTEYAVKSTTERMKVFGTNAKILQMDAEKLDFPDQSFDFIWTWGVIHHSSDTRAILKQMHRVLRPGGSAVVMVYHRNFWEYYVRRGLLRGMLNGQLWRAGSLHKVVQLSTDGGLARYYRVPEWEQLAGEFFQVGHSRIVGIKSHVIPVPGRLRPVAEKIIPNFATRFASNSLGLGQFLVSELSRPASDR
jgi:ubiquinone/menaquinone biosynthesis C-methylase UbiE